jgi:hypothetical protein
MLGPYPKTYTPECPGGPRHYVLQGSKLSWGLVVRLALLAQELVKYVCTSLTFSPEPSLPRP